MKEKSVFVRKASGVFLLAFGILGLFLPIVPGLFFIVAGSGFLGVDFIKKIGKKILEKLRRQ